MDFFGFEVDFFSLKRDKYWSLREFRRFFERTERVFKLERELREIWENFDDWESLKVWKEKFKRKENLKITEIF